MKVKLYLLVATGRSDKERVRWMFTVCHSHFQRGLGGIGPKGRRHLLPE
jgi:hypothetical protein